MWNDVQIKVSIVIPCYNMREYLPKCLETIWNQTLQEIEVICIDDGSNDGTYELLQEYQKHHENLVVVRQDNKGAGLARNRGIDIAGGMYIAFMDADDFYPHERTLELLYGKAQANDADICGGMADCYIDNKSVRLQQAWKENVIDKEGWVDKKDFILMRYWCYIYRRFFLKYHSIVFPDYLRFQDPPFFVKAISKARKVYCLCMTTYCYRKGHKVVHFEGRKALDHIRGVRDCFRIAYEEALDGIYENILRVNLEKSRETAIMYHLAYLENEEAREIIHQINEIIEKTNQKHNRNDKLLLEGDEINKYVKQIMKEGEQWIKEIATATGILVYGAGRVGINVCSFLHERGIFPEAFVVTDTNKNIETIWGLKVCAIDDYLLKKDEYVVVVAVVAVYQEEICRTLKEKGFGKVYIIDSERIQLWQ